MNKKPIAAVVLAAGRSSRMGTPKQLLSIKGKTLLRRTVETVLATHVDVVVVVSHHPHEVEDLPIVQAGLYRKPENLSDSIKNGLSAIRDWEIGRCLSIGAALFVPCDLPLLSSRHLDSLIEHYQNGVQIVASHFANVLGAPMLFDRALWEELDDLRGDVGGRHIISRHEEATIGVAFEGGRFDLDTPQDVKEFEREFLSSLD